MKEFTRQPTRGERALAIVLTIALVTLFSSLAVFLAIRGAPAPAAICGAIASACLVLLYRAARGARRALSERQSQALAWVLLLLGMGGFILVLAIRGSLVHRLMVLGGAIAFFSAGLAGIRRQRQDA